MTEATINPNSLEDEQQEKVYQDKAAAMREITQSTVRLLHEVIELMQEERDGFAFAGVQTLGELYEVAKSIGQEHADKLSAMGYATEIQFASASREGAMARRVRDAVDPEFTVEDVNPENAWYLRDQKYVLDGNDESRAPEEIFDGLALFMDNVADVSDECAIAARKAIVHLAIETAEAAFQCARFEFYSLPGGGGMFRGMRTDNDGFQKRLKSYSDLLERYSKHFADLAGLEDS